MYIRKYVPLDLKKEHMAVGDGKGRDDAYLYTGSKSNLGKRGMFKI